MTLIDHIAAKMYIHYCRIQGHHKSMSDSEILTKFHNHWIDLFATRTAKENWQDRAKIAVEAYTEWMKRKIPTR